MFSVSTYAGENRSHVHVAIAAFAILLGFTLEAEAQCRIPVTIRFVGSNTLGSRLLPKLLEEYNRSSPEECKITFTMSFEGTKKGWCQFEKQTPNEPVHVVAASAALQESHLCTNRYKDKVLSLQGPDNEHVIALDGIPIIVNNDNPVRHLTMGELQSIFCSQEPEFSWKVVGWNDKRADVIARNTDSGTTATVGRIVCAGGTVPASVKGLSSNDEVVEKISVNKYAIGYASLGALTSSRENVKQVKIDDCGRIYLPDTYSVKTEDYPLSRRLLLYTPDPQVFQLLRPFLEFAKGRRGQQIVNNENFVGLSIDEVGDNSSDEGRKELIKEGRYNIQSDIERFQDTTRAAKRLSIVFRFQPRTDALDSRGIADIKRMLQYIGELPRGNEIRFLGFADAEGTYAGSQRVADQRSKRVRDLVADAARARGIAVSTHSFGSELPVACNRNQAGRERNRRVEVWVRPAAQRAQ